MTRDVGRRTYALMGFDPPNTSARPRSPIFSRVSRGDSGHWGVLGRYLEYRSVCVVPFIVVSDQDLACHVSSSQKGAWGQLTIPRVQIKMYNVLLVPICLEGCMTLGTLCHLRYGLFLRVQPRLVKGLWVCQSNHAPKHCTQRSVNLPRRPEVSGGETNSTRTVPRAPCPESASFQPRLCTDGHENHRVPETRGRGRCRGDRALFSSSPPFHVPSQRRS